MVRMLLKGQELVVFKTRMFVTIRHLRHSLIFASKTGFCLVGKLLIHHFKPYLQILLQIGIVLKTKT